MNHQHNNERRDSLLPDISQTRLVSGTDYSLLLKTMVKTKRLLAWEKQRGLTAVTMAWKNKGRKWISITGSVYLMPSTSGNYFYQEKEFLVESSCSLVNHFLFVVMTMSTTLLDG